MFRFLSIFLALAFVSLAGCSKAPEAYNVKTKPAPPVDLNKAIPTEEQFTSKTTLDKNGKVVSIQEILERPISDIEVEGSFTWDAKVKANSSRPIIYGEGVGGLTFDTTLEEAASILVKPRQGPDEEGYAFYDEGLYILWRRDEPRTPAWILILQNYLGVMNMPVPLKPIGMGYDFAKDGYKVNKKEGAEQIAKVYYRILENQPADFDCVQQQKCQVTWGDDSKKDFIFEIPGKLLWLVSKDRFVLYRMLIQQPKPGLPFDLEILSGNLLVPEEAPLGLGQQFSDIEKRLETSLEINPLDIKTTVGMDTFGRLYGGTTLIYQKTIFDRDAIQPLSTDPLSLVQVWDSYAGAIVLDENRLIVVTETRSGVDLRIAQKSELSLLQETVDQREIPLQIRLGLQPKNVRSFVEKLQQLIATEMKTIYPQSIIASRFTGSFQRRTVKDYSAYVVAFDQAANTGLFVQFAAGEELGSLSYFTILRLGGPLNPLDSLLFGAVNTPVEKAVGEVEVISDITGKPIPQPDGSTLKKQDKLPVFTQLSGLAIGDQIAVTEWDLGRGEATIRLTKQGKTYPPLRASYADRSLIQVAFDSEKEAPQEVAYVSFGSLSIGVGLTLISEDPVLRTYKVVSVTSNLNTTKVLDLCGQKFAPEYGMSSVQFLEKLALVPSCVYLPKKDEGGNGRLTSVYFPQDRIRLGFDEDEMVSATIYAPNSEVQ